jgi:hypothetical protein
VWAATAADHSKRNSVGRVARGENGIEGVGKAGRGQVWECGGRRWERQRGQRRRGEGLTARFGGVDEGRGQSVRGRKGGFRRGGQWRGCDGGFGPPGTKARWVGGGGRASLVRRSGECGAADARPKLSTHRSGGGRYGGHKCERHGRGGESQVGSTRRPWQERSRRGCPNGERAWRVRRPPA